MRGLTRELLSAFLVLTLVYLALVHFTGFGRDIAAISNFTTSTWKVAQGR